MKKEMRNSMNLCRKESDLRMEFLKADSEEKQDCSPILRLLYKYYTESNSLLRFNRDANVPYSSTRLFSSQPNRNLVRKITTEFGKKVKAKVEKEMEEKYEDTIINLQSTLNWNEERMSYLEEENKQLWERLELSNSVAEAINHNNDEKELEIKQIKSEKQMSYNETDMRSLSSFNKMAAFHYEQIYGCFFGEGVKFDSSFDLKLDMKQDNAHEFIQLAIVSFYVFPKINSLSIQNCECQFDQISDFLENCIKQSIPCLNLSGSLSNFVEASIGINRLLKIIPNVTKELSFKSFMLTSKELSNVIGKASQVQTLSLLNLRWIDYYQSEEGIDSKFELEKGEYKIKTLKLSVICEDHFLEGHGHLLAQYETMILEIRNSSLKDSLEHLYFIDGPYAPENDVTSLICNTGLNHIALHIGQEIPSTE
ncbi:unnamed protein product [Moneuplotes crassus]|uniref:Uncharacterized protein n=1 Tax=Euplotes crassus TaxID=5936 RepID=A0AAD1Y9Q6_EUPCR|nr:unnamed protein product [Moneuplotes crassus]